jgi:hypothetical protein
MPPKCSSAADEQLAALRQAVTSAPKYGMNGRALLLEELRKAAADDSDDEDVDEGPGVGARAGARQPAAGGPRAAAAAPAAQQQQHKAAPIWNCEPARCAHCPHLATPPPPHPRPSRCP